ncbi:acyltransferase family protein [Mycobacterium sp. 155]|uniref:acyltransferase family protein n=1 Tax=Mycobacterium sp. 155 TaxID=1157943 RepID=UPI00037E98CC|nr:acyltransferase family protein [Mycobacterium sp. 155]
MDVTAAPVRVAVRRAATPRRGIPALDGIRAVAVLLVVAAHGGVPGLGGGFIGVDVFFVLSGFLITSLLLDEHRNTYRIDLKAFWVRRARRLLPAMLVMTLAVVAARDLFPPESVADVRNDAVSAFFWIANWGFVLQKADYFTQGGAPSPLQHTWSLGVEEQYYVIWPVLLVGAALLLRRRSARTVRWAVFGLAAAGVAASAAEAILLVGDSTQDVNRVYFGTDTRVQALLVGAAAAALLVRDWSALTMSGTLIRTRRLRWVAWLLPVVGLAMLAVAAHLATGSADDFRHGLLTVVAVAAVLVVAPVALDQDGYVAKALAWRPLVALGAISYGVYLWHWPVFLILDGERTGWTSWSLLTLRCAVTLAAAIVSWWLIEQPVRRWRPTHVPMLRLAAATVATAAAVTMGVLPVTQPSERTGPDVMSAALKEDVGAEVPVPVGGVPVRDPGTKVVGVFGDSVAWTLMRYLPTTPGLRFSDYTTIGCGVVRGGPYRSSGETLNQKPECDTWPERWTQRVTHDRPDIVLLMIGRWETVDRMWQGHWTHIGDPDFDKYLQGELQRALDILGSTGARVVVTTALYNRRGERADGSLYPEDQPARVQEWNKILRAVVGKHPNFEVLDFNAKLNPGGAYTARVDGIRMRSDGVHPTAEAVKWLAPWLADSLRNLPPPPPPPAPQRKG